MENQHTPDNQKRYPSPNNRSRRVFGGLFIVLIGVFLLARQAGADMPGWLFSFEMALIALGVYLGIRHTFKGFGWMIPILIGGFLLMDDFYPDYDVHRFMWPVIIIGFGLLVMFRSGRFRCGERPRDRGKGAENTSDDYLDSVVIFGGVKKKVISKNFWGGETVTVFGGTEINLTQADLNGVATLELTQVFGGTKLIIPANWKVQSSDMVAIFGGIDDKRPPANQTATEQSEKTLVLKGTCIMGGIDIRSY